MTATDAIARMMSRDEFAALLGLTPRTLENWASQGKGPMPVKIGRAVRYKSDEVAAFVRGLQQRA
jgi:predicted DNA-binding transcriptional regulator AlpA